MLIQNVNQRVNISLFLSLMISPGLKNDDVSNNNDTHLKSSKAVTKGVLHGKSPITFFEEKGPDKH